MNVMRLRGGRGMAVLRAGGMIVAVVIELRKLSAPREPLSMPLRRDKESKHAIVKCEANLDW